MQKFGDVVLGEHFQIWGWMDGGRKMCVLRKN